MVDAWEADVVAMGCSCCGKLWEVWGERSIASMGPTDLKGDADGAQGVCQPLLSRVGRYYGEEVKRLGFTTSGIGC